jgi:hypothetical protein
MFVLRYVGKNMATKPSSEAAWIATRTYRIRRVDANDWETLFVGIEAPRKLQPSERIITGEMSEYGCLIQIGPDRTRHFALGRDALQALFSGILAIEIGLTTMSSMHLVANLDGTAFDIKQEGFLLGSLATAYFSQLNSINPTDSPHRLE